MEKPWVVSQTPVLKICLHNPVVVDPTIALKGMPPSILNSAYLINSVPEHLASVIFSPSEGVRSCQIFSMRIFFVALLIILLCIIPNEFYIY